jgi:hypothetical protein
MSDTEKNEGDILEREKSLEEGKEVPYPHATVVADSKYHFDASDLDQVQRRLLQRHVQMYCPFSALYRIHTNDSIDLLGSL